MYLIPDSAKSEINAFARLVHDFRNVQIDPVKFKAIRVPMGIYEQRTNGTSTMRVRCTAGMITSRQLIQVALPVQKEGTKSIHITTRQELPNGRRSAYQECSGLCTP